MSRDLTLFAIETDLANLIEVRDEMQEKGEDLQHIEQAICDYVAKSVKKVDGISSYIKHAEMMESAAKAESARLKAVSATWAGRIEHLKHFVRFVMEGMEWDEGKVRKLEGKTGSLILKLDGGKPAVEITNESLLPAALKTITIKVNAAVWDAFQTECQECSRSMAVALSRLMASENFYGLIEINKARIAAALEKACPGCGGNEIVPCQLCGGSGKAVVPGARFAERGSSVIVK